MVAFGSRYGGRPPDGAHAQPTAASCDHKGLALTHRNTFGLRVVNQTLDRSVGRVDLDGFTTLLVDSGTHADCVVCEAGEHSGVFQTLPVEFRLPLGEIHSLSMTIGFRAATAEAMISLTASPMNTSAWADVLIGDHYTKHSNKTFGKALPSYLQPGH